MQTTEIVKALRCISAPDAEERHCENCPFCVKEVLDAEYTAIFGGGEVDACDCDAVGNLAADRLEELLDRCARYAEETMELREKQQWISVTERLPAEGMRVLAASEGVFSGEAYLSCEGVWMRSYGVVWVSLVDMPVTHWMPLPYKPEVTCGG